MLRSERVSNGVLTPDRLRWSIFLLGLALSGLLIARVGAGADAVDLLARGWLLADKGIWVPLGNPASGGGYVPGGLSALLVGAPLLVWADYRAPILLILILHVVAYVLLDRVVKESLGPRARVILAVVYWLNPWRIYGATWLDNTNYTFLTGAVHLWACYRQRLRPSFVHSAILVAVVGLTAQLHLNAVLLVFAAVLLWWRRCWKPHWGGVAVGTAITLVAFVPYLNELQHQPQILPGREDPGRDSPSRLGLLQGWPLLKGLVYWFRYASLWGSARSMYEFDFAPSVGPVVGPVLSRLFVGLGLGVGGLTVVFPVLANVSQWRRRRVERRRRSGPPASERAWFREYALWLFVACVVANALSPTPVMWWHNLIALPAAILPVILWADSLLHTRHAIRVRRSIIAWLALSVVLIVGMSFGGDYFRGGAEVASGPVRHEMLRDLDLGRLGIDHVPRQSWYFYREYMRPYEIPPPDSGPRAP